MGTQGKTYFSITPLEPKSHKYIYIYIFLTSPDCKFRTAKKMTPKSQATLKHSFP